MTSPHRAIQAVLDNAGHLSPLLGEIQGEVPVGRPHPCGRPVYLDAQTIDIWLRGRAYFLLNFI